MLLVSYMLSEYDTQESHLVPRINNLFGIGDFTILPMEKAFYTSFINSH